MTLSRATGYIYGWKSPEHRIAAIWEDACQDTYCNDSDLLDVPVPPHEFFVQQTQIALRDQMEREEDPDYPSEADGIYDRHLKRVK